MLLTEFFTIKNSINKIIWKTLFLSYITDEQSGKKNFTPTKCTLLCQNVINIKWLNTLFYFNFIERIYINFIYQTNVGQLNDKMKKVLCDMFRPSKGLHQISCFYWWNCIYIGRSNEIQTNVSYNYTLGETLKMQGGITLIFLISGV